MIKRYDIRPRRKKQNGGQGGHEPEPDPRPAAAADDSDPVVPAPVYDEK
jgi:hypothetical protein